MANITDNLSYDWNKLETAVVAHEYLKQGKQGIPLAQKSLELLAQDISANSPGIIRTITDPEVIEKAINHQLKDYYGGLNKATVKDRLDYYKEGIDDYLQDINVKEELKPFLDMKYEDVQRKIITSQHTLEGKEKGVDTSEEDVEVAKRVLEEYKKVYSTINMLENRKNKKIRDRVEREYYRESIRKLYSNNKRE